MCANILRLLWNERAEILVKKILKLSTVKKVKTEKKSVMFYIQLISHILFSSFKVLDSIEQLNGNDFNLF